MRSIKRKYNTKPNKTSFKIGHEGMKEELNPSWKGDNAGYGSKHDWIKLHFGKPNSCENCDQTDKKKYEWANISKQYLRDRADWKRLCTSCHRLMDGHAKKMWETRRQYA